MKYVAFAAVALVWASPVLAGKAPTVSIQWTPQGTAVPKYTTAGIIQTFSAPLIPAGKSSTPYPVAPGEKGTFFNGMFQDYSVPPSGNHDARTSLYNSQLSDCPTSLNKGNCGMTGQYLGVVKGSDYVINFLKSGVQFFSFAFNNLQTDDHLKLYFSDGTSQDYTAQDILNGGSIINVQNKNIPTAPNDWGRVWYDMTGGISLVKADFSTGSGPWYIDSIAAAAPEPGTWVLMLIGFGLAGARLRRSQRRSKPALT